MSVKFFIEGVLTGVLGLFGIFGNIVSIKVMSSKDLDMLPTFRHLLKMLAGFDATFLIFTLSLFCISSWSNHYELYVRPWLTPYWLPIIQISLTGSVWTTMAVSVERYLTVCLSYRSNTVQHLFYTLPIILFSIIFNIPRFFELTVVLELTDVTEYNETLGEYINVTRELPIINATAIRSDPNYSRDYVLIANSFALAFIPTIVLVVLNSLIYRTISQATRRHNAISSNQRRDHSVAMMLITIVVVFIICHSLRSIVNTYECIQMALYGELKHWPEWIQTLVHCNHFALVVNSSINILIYSCKDEKFLRVLLITIGLKPARSRAQSIDVEMTHLPPPSHEGTLERKARLQVKTDLDAKSNHSKVVTVYTTNDMKSNDISKTNNASPDIKDDSVNSGSNGFCHRHSVGDETSSLLNPSTNDNVKM